VKKEEFTPSHGEGYNLGGGKGQSTSEKGQATSVKGNIPSSPISVFVSSGLARK